MAHVAKSKVEEVVDVVERFNRTYRHEVLDCYAFESLSQVRQITEQWGNEYNEDGRHSSLGKLPPAMFRRQVEKALNCLIDGEAYELV